MKTMMLLVDHTPRRLAILREGVAQPLLIQNAPENRRAFIHPWRAPDGSGELTEDAPPHHPWQHGLYVGLNGVDGVGFWTEGLNKATADGTFHPEPLAPPERVGESVSWSVVSEWRDSSGKPLLTETQSYRFHESGATCLLDVTWTLKARRDLTFGKYAYGGLFLRMPWRADANGTVCTSEGLTTPAAADQKRARWVAIAMGLPGRANGPAGVAFLDHPSNPEHPAPWRIDGQLGIAPSRCIAGEWHLKAGESTHNRYQLLSFLGNPDPVAVEAAWRKFSHE